MRKTASKENNFRKELIKLSNTIHWDPKEGDNVYLENVHMSIAELPFATRQVFLRFAGGPGFDSCLVDMDRLVLAYLNLRGLKPPPELRKLAQRKAPPAVDFIVPNHLMSNLAKRTHREQE